MANIISGPGQGLPPPQALYPPLLWAGPYTAPTNRFEMSAGQALRIPPGTWIVEGGDVSRTQWLDPVDRQWNNLVRSPAIPDPTRHWGTTIRSDGFNFRVANLSGVPQGAQVSSPGANYVAATTQVVPTVGLSRWRAVVGGSLDVPTIVDPGANYVLPPLVFVPAPPYPGVCATGKAVLTSGQVTGITWDNPGAGYPYPPTIVLMPDPFDPNYLDAGEQERFQSKDVIKNARVSVTLTGNGTVTAVLLVLAGDPQAAPPSLTIMGQGTGAAATVVPTAWIAPQDDELTIQPASGG